MDKTPKFNVGDKVSFIISGIPMSGTIISIDLYGIFMDNSTVYYDILAKQEKYKTSTNKDGACRLKHVREASLTKIE